MYEMITAYRRDWLHITEHKWKHQNNQAERSSNQLRTNWACSAHSASNQEALIYSLLLQSKDLYYTLGNAITQHSTYLAQLMINIILPNVAGEVKAARIRKMRINANYVKLTPEFFMQNVPGSTKVQQLKTVNRICSNIHCYRDRIHQSKNCILLLYTPLHRAIHDLQDMLLKGCKQTQEVSHWLHNSQEVAKLDFLQDRIHHEDTTYNPNHDHSSLTHENRTR